LCFTKLDSDREEGGGKSFARTKRGPRGLKIKQRKKRAAGSHLSQACGRDKQLGLKKVPELNRHGYDDDVRRAAPFAGVDDHFGPNKMCCFSLFNDCRDMS
jgi:hypothetical protein